MSPGPRLPAGWPALSFREAEARLTAPGALKQELKRESGFTGAGRALEQDVAIGVERGEHELDLAPPAHHVPAQSLEQVGADHAGQSLTMTPRMFSPSRIAR